MDNLCVKLEWKVEKNIHHTNNGTIYVSYFCLYIFLYCEYIDKDIASLNKNYNKNDLQSHRMEYCLKQAPYVQRPQHFIIMFRY